MKKILIAGSGTGVGKTVVSAILMTLFEADYWKPIQCGPEKDSDIIAKWVDRSHHIYPSAYSLNAALSPHHASRLENIIIDRNSIILPQTKRSLIIESVGGIFVPLTSKHLTFDIFKSWDCQWILVSSHYLGSINHTLLTLNVLRNFSLPIMGIIFNGEPNLDSEEAILEISQVPFLARLLPETHLNVKTIKKYVKQWKHRFHNLDL